VEVAVVAPPFAETVVATVNFEVLSQPGKLIFTFPAADAPGVMDPTGTGKVPGAICGAQAVPPVRVSVIFVMFALFAGPTPPLYT